MSESVDKALLLDFYGELLTPKQREYCSLRWNEDLSLAEIAESGGLTRQGVWDVLRRAEKTLTEMERKTGLIRRYLERRELIAGVRNDLAALLPDNDETRALLARFDGLV